MGWFENLGNAVSSGLAVVGDVAETIVETVTDTAENAVDAGADTAQEGINHVVDWININGGPIAGGIANVVGGVINGAIEAGQEIVTDILHIVKDAGRMVGSLLRLDIPGLGNAFLHLLLDVGILVVDVVRSGTGGFIAGQIVENFERNSLRQFVDGLLQTSFAEPRLTEIRERLGMSTPQWGLQCQVTHKTCTMESPAMPLAAMHTNHTLDLFAMGGLLSFDSFELFRPRYIIKWLDENGAESILRASRYHIARFLERGSPNLRVYAESASDLRDSIQFATEHFKAMGIRLSWNHFFTIPQLTPLVTHRITETPEFNLLCWLKQELPDGTTLREVRLGFYLSDTGLKNPTEGETRITSLTTFHVFVKEWDATGAVSSSEDFRGMTAGRDIKEGPESVGCATMGRTDGCCSVVQRQEKRDIGSGIAKRNVYPGFFSKVVMAHELGHYFGLCHINHNGVQNLMFSPKNKIFDWGLFRYYLRSEPHFSQRDERNVWRFIVDQLRNEL